MKFVGHRYLKVATGFQTWLDESYYEEMVSDLGLSEAKAAVTPYATATRPSNLYEKEQWDEKLSVEETYLYRKCFGKVRYASSGASRSWPKR